MTNTPKPSNTTNASSTQHPSDAHSSGIVNHRWLGFFAVLTALIMNILDSTIVNVAAPSIRTELGASYCDLQWIAAGYTLALAVGLLTGGRLGDLFGRRTMLLIGVVGFAASSLACAAAPSPGALIAARVVQGLFGAAMIPQGFGLLRDLFPPQELGKAFGALGPVIGLSTILGPIVAGTLIDANLFGTGWRMVFGINLPLAAFTLFGGFKALPRRATRSGNAVRLDRVRLDGVGALLAGAGMFLLVYPLVQGRELGWPSWMAFVTAGAVAVFALFAAQQARRSRRGVATLVEFSVLTKRSYAGGTLFTLVFFGGIVGFSLTVGLLLQLGFGYTPVHAALTMVAWAIGAFFGAGFSATMMHKLGRRILHLGLSIMAVSLVGLYLVLGHAHSGLSGSGLSGWRLAPSLGAYGLGMGMIFVPLFDIIMGEVSDREVGSASAILESLQQLGASVGVAGLGTVFFGTIGAHPHTAGYLQATQRVTLVTIALVAAAFALGFLLPRRARQAGPDAPNAEFETKAAPKSGTAIDIDDVEIISELEPVAV
ncbi:MAG TPA: MFS transporter [Actinocrinis sp.]|uniref:MFS transporter n=1 Tax=Actinocrinis sp. TaxID=1920516 RepID=UPI002DDD2D5A|nr:MFS transporter [Actinocrinis sp.]HEV2345681.1 MFS transporter [Actinocrinis sp.]